MAVTLALAGDTMLGRAVGERLAEIGVTCVTLANNHALDFGPDALLDTLVHLKAVGIAAASEAVTSRLGEARCAGADDVAARAPVVLEGGGLRVLPLRLELAHTRQASDVEATLLLALLEERCAAVGSTVRREGERLVFDPR